MTIRERAEEIAREIGRDNLAYEDITIIEQAIIAAVEVEREACAKAAEEAGPTFYHKDMREAATSIAATIRARGGKK